MKKEDFSTINTAPAANTLATQLANATTAPKTTTNTKIHVALTPENNRYIRLMAYNTGMKLADLVNAIITAHREAKGEEMAQLLEAMEAADESDLFKL